MLFMFARAFECTAEQGFKQKGKREGKDGEMMLFSSFPYFQPTWRAEANTSLLRIFTASIAYFRPCREGRGLSGSAA